MNSLVKTTLRNILCKPLRTILVIFSIFACSISALLCFDLSGTMRVAMMGEYTSFSNADYEVLLRPGEELSLPEDFPEADAFQVCIGSEKFYSNIPGEYNYAKSQNLKVYGLDLDKASKMNIVDEMQVGYMETVITYGFAQKFGYSEGDKITLHDNIDEPHEFKIVKIIPEDEKNILLSTDTALISAESSEVLTRGQGCYSLAMIDVKDDDLAAGAKELLLSRYDEDSVTDLIAPEEMIALLDNLASILTMVFVITFLLVIFVTYSICERIVSERMSFIGTLRSLGMSAKGTAGLLLLENIFYALFGSIPAVILYSLIRKPLLDSFLYMESADGSHRVIDYPALSAVLMVSVLLGAVLIECLIPLRAVLKALKVSIRDIIFDNRNTEYKLNKVAITIGLMLFVIAVSLSLFRGSIGAATISMICYVTGLALTFPLLFKQFTSLMRKLADKRDNAAMRLALTEASARKSTITSGVLCATSATMIVLIFAISASAINVFTAKMFSADIKMDYSKDEAILSYIDYLDGVTDVEKLYYATDEVRFGEDDGDHIRMVYGVPDGGYKYFNLFIGLPEKIEEGTMYIPAGMRDSYGLKVGDKLTVVFNSTSIFQIKKEMTIAGIFDSTSVTDGKNALVLSQADYIKVFHDIPAELLITSDDSERTAALINKYSRTVNPAKTVREIDEADRRDASSTVAIFVAVMGIAVVMTCIGMISNQIIGFEGRKKELAVMMSTAMSRKKLSGVLIREIFVMSGFASGLGVIIGALICVVLKAAIARMDGIYFDITVEPLPLLLLWIVMTVLYTVTVLFPISRMKKMKLSEQIKYE